MTTPEDDFADKTKVLNERYIERLGQSRRELERDRGQGKKYAAEAFPEGAFGRISEETPADIMQFLDDRRKSVSDAQSQGVIDQDMRRQDIQNITGAYSDLIKERSDPESKYNTALRDQAQQTISGELRGQMRDIRGAGNAGGYSGGLSAGLVNDAIGQSIQSRVKANQDVAIGAQQAKEDLTGQMLGQRSEALGALTQENRAREQVQNELQSRLEDVRGTIRQDRLDRQLQNLQQASAERYGRLGAEESYISQGIAERSGIRQELLSESQLAEQTRHQQEQEKIQRIEAEKPPPSTGGGKSVLCIAHWLKGDIDDETLKGDFEYAEAYIDDDVRRGYFEWSTPYANRVVEGSWLSWFSRPIVKMWAKEMAFRMGRGKRGSIGGRICCIVGVPICKAIGMVMRWCGNDAIIPPAANPLLNAASALHPKITLWDRQVCWLNQREAV